MKLTAVNKCTQGTTYKYLLYGHTVYTHYELTV